MRGLRPLIFLFLLQVTNGQEEDIVDDKNEEYIQTGSNFSNETMSNNIGDELGSSGSEEEACSDCDETISAIDEEASSNATELNVLESASYSMASIGSTTIFVRLDRVEGQDNLQMVCQ